MMFILEPFGIKLKKLRARLGINQQQLAERAGLHRGRVSNLENHERTPTHEELDRIAEALGVSPRQLGGCVPPASADQPQLLRRFRRPRRPPTTEHIFPVYRRLETAREKYPEVMGPLLRSIKKRADAALCQNWLGWIPSDACEEILPWLWLLEVVETIPRFLSVEQLDFDTLPIAETRTCRDCKSQLRPCLEVPLQDGGVAILFPQVPVQTSRQPYRVDCLAECVRRYRRATAVVEVDGDGHDRTFDERRAAALKVPILRKTSVDVVDPEYAPRLVSELDRLLRGLPV